MARVVFFLLLMPFAAVAANNDDGYVWVDANTKIRLKPIGSAAVGATAPEPQKAPEQPQKARKKEKTPK